MTSKIYFYRVLQNETLFSTERNRRFFFLAFCHSFNCFLQVLLFMYSFLPLSLEYFYICKFAYCTFAVWSFGRFYFCLFKHLHIFKFSNLLLLICRLAVWSFLHLYIFKLSHYNISSLAYQHISTLATTRSPFAYCMLL